MKTLFIILLLSASECIAVNSCNYDLGLDGSGGFLYKPESEKNGNLVVLLPSYLPNADLVLVERKLKKKRKKKCDAGTLNGRKCERKKEALWFNGRHNGDRQTWYAARPGARYKSKRRVMAWVDDEVYCWKIGKSSERND